MNSYSNGITSTLLLACVYLTVSAFGLELLSTLKSDFLLALHLQRTVLMVTRDVDWR